MSKHLVDSLRSDRYRKRFQTTLLSVVLGSIEWLAATAPASAQEDCSANFESLPDVPCDLYTDCWATTTLSPREPSCTTDQGGQGQILCEFTPDGRVGWSCTANPPDQESGTVIPKFMILTVVYAPPGSADCKYNSSVSYGEGNRLGTTISASKAMKTDTKVGVSVSAGAVGYSVEVGATFGVGVGTSSSEEMSVSKSTQSAISASGPCTDGIDHDYDQIWLLLQPDVEVTIATPSGCPTCSGGEATWSLKPNTGKVFWVYAGEINGRLTPRQSTADALSPLNLSLSELLFLIAADPLAISEDDPTFVPDTGRYVRLPVTFPYETPLNGSTGGSSYSMSTEASAVSTEAFAFDYSVGLSVSASAGFGDVLKAKLSYDSSWTWSNSNSAAFSESQSTSASATIGSPSENYTGPHAFALYYDTIFKTYAFVPTH